MIKENGFRAAVVEDDVAIARLLKIHLAEAGFEVEVFHDAEAAFLDLQKTNRDLCLVDWMLPRIQGIDFIKRVRAQNQKIKLMMVTAKTDAESIVQGLEAGADDYLTKPFDARVLIARVRNLMRRRQFEKGPQLVADHVSIDGMTIHYTKHFVNYNGSDIHLTLSEFKLLASLFKAQGQVLTREQLIERIQGEDVSVTGRTIDTHVFALRKKMGKWATHIETIRGVGYRILMSSEDATEAFSEAASDGKR